LLPANDGQRKNRKEKESEAEKREENGAEALGRAGGRKEGRRLRVPPKRWLRKKKPKKGCLSTG
jgi:hypothetical protein